MYYCTTELIFRTFSAYHSFIVFVNCYLSIVMLFNTDPGETNITDESDPPGIFEPVEQDARFEGKIA
jgi:hypothetical protein